MIKKLFFTLALFSIFAANTAFADVRGVVLPDDYKPQYAVSFTPPDTSNRAGVANLIMQLVAGSLIYLAGPVAVLFIAVGGFRYVISRGDQTAMEEAKKNITWAIIGLVVIALSYAIVYNIINLTSEKIGVSGPESSQGQSTGS